MVIEIKSELFENIDHLADINYLIAIFSEKRRFLFYCEIDDIKETEVYNNLLPIHRELIQENFNSIISQSREIDHKIEENTTSHSFDLNEAKRFFNQPVLLILENSLNDSYFIDALVKNFKNKSKTIKRHKENGWIKYEMGGGCDNIINYIRALIKSYEGLPKNGKQYLRCMVIVDSDKRFETEPTREDRKHLYEFLNEIGISYHELEKREMENYIPDEALENIQEIDDYITAYLRLSPIQKDYFDLERGFDNKNISSLSEGIQYLYNNIGKEDLGILRKGMGMEKYQRDGRFKSEFPKLFESDQVTQKSLLKRTMHQSKDPDELQTILDKITRLL